MPVYFQVAGYFALLGTGGQALADVGIVWKQLLQFAGFAQQFRSDLQNANLKSLELEKAVKSCLCKGGWRLEIAF